MSASFVATPAELGLVNQIFAQADKQKLGILNGDVAVKVFGGANLPGPVLGEIWNIADDENNGWLSRTGTAKAVRLIGHAQKGTKVSAALLSKSGPLPTIEGYTSIAQHNTGASIPKSPPPGFPPLSPQDKAKFQNIFNRSGPANGLLSGEKARDIFLRSKLSTDHLLQIWNLADTRDRGSLDVADFTVAMYFIQGLMTKQISFVPTTLPPGLYEQAGGSTSGIHPQITTHTTGGSGSFSPLGSTFGVQPQITGQNRSLSPNNSSLSPQPRAPTLPNRPVPPPFRPASVAHGHANNEWDVTPNEKAEADAIFISQLDTNNVGYIEGDIAVPFMLKSQLPGEDLAQIWDLADFNSDGRLTRDGFAIAFHLIKKKMAGQPLPAQLPQSLMPPSLRKQAPFLQGPQTQPEPPRDLLDLDDTPPASAVSPQNTGTMPPLRPQGTGATTVPPIPPRNHNMNDPFASSPFGTGSGVASDLMGDHDDRPHTTSPPLQDRSAELGNVRNQLQSTNRSLDTTKAERAKMESTLASQAAELSALQTQLSSAKAAYDTETTLLSQLKERYTTQSAEIQKLREDLIHSESDLSAIRVEKAEIEQAFLRDKEEARDLHRRMIEAGQQSDQLKGDVEKAKKEAKQQKGRLAIARKQLATKEAEKAKVEKELEEAAAEVQTTTQEAEEVEAQITNLAQPQPVRALSQDTIDIAAAQPLPASPEPMAASKSNNPFERLAKSSSPSPRSQSPFLPFGNAALASPPISPPEVQNGQAKQTTQSSFDDFFGVDSPGPAPDADEASKPVVETNGNSESKELELGKFDHFSRLSMLNQEDSIPTPASPVTSTEHFVTPPTTANNEGPPERSDSLANDARARFPTLGDAANEFPDLDKEAAAGREKKDTEQSMTDLGTKLEELEVDESDSDDSDDDSPLTEVAQKAKAKAASPVVDVKPAETAPTATVTTSPSAQPESSFNDIFGSDDTPAFAASPTAEPPQPSSSPFDITTLARSTEPATVKETAGANAFDETLGFSPPSSAAPAQFSFDGFEDSFDFGANGGTQVMPVPQPEAATTALAPSMPAPAGTQQATSSKQPSFDEIFSAPSPTTSAQRAVPTPFTNGSTGPTEAPKPTTSFDDAFAGFDANPNLNLESSFVTTTSAETGASQSTPSSKPFPSSVPVSPKAAEASSPRPSVNRPSSPAPRPTSPAPRKSTSSKDSHEKLKEPAGRSSKLSIRFPFGKKKNKGHPEPMPPPPSTLSPPAEEPHRVRTPASDDDVEAVKQIVGMGFSRTQAVEALERHGYDVTRAINSLLQ